MFVTLSCFNERLSEFPMSDRDKQKQMHYDAFEKNGTGALQTPQAPTNPTQSVDPGTLSKKSQNSARALKCGALFA